MTRNPQGNSYNRNGQFQCKDNKTVHLGPKGVIGTPKEPLKCWECEGPHLQRNFPLLGESNKTVHNLQEASTMGEIGKSFHWINVNTKNCSTSSTWPKPYTNIIFLYFFSHFLPP